MSFVAIIQVTVDGKHQYLLLVNEKKTAIHGFRTLREGLNCFTDMYESGHRRSYEASMSACLNWMFFRPVILEASEEDIRSWFSDPSKTAIHDASCGAGFFSGVKLDEEIGQRLWESGTKPELIRAESAQAKNVHR